MPEKIKFTQLYNANMYLFFTRVGKTLKNILGICFVSFLFSGKKEDQQHCGGIYKLK